MAADAGAPNLAVLIDADSTSARYAQAIFEEIVKLGEANVGRIYGDFSGCRLAGWDAAIQSLASTGICTARRTAFRLDVKAGALAPLTKMPNEGKCMPRRHGRRRAANRPNGRMPLTCSCIATYRRSPSSRGRI